MTILSYSRYCRYRATLKRLEHVSDDHVRVKLIETLSGFVASQPNTRIMFAKETIDFPDILESHELLCPHLAPKLKGKPRGRRKKLLSRISECSSPAPSSEFSVDSCETNDSDVFQGKHLVGICRYLVLQSQAQNIFRSRTSTIKIPASDSRATRESQNLRLRKFTQRYPQVASRSNECRSRH